PAGQRDVEDGRAAVAAVDNHRNGDRRGRLAARRRHDGRGWRNSMTATALACLRPALGGAEASLVMRSATPADAPSVQTLIERHRVSGHLLPRSESEIAGRAQRFLVIVDDDVVAGCAELAPLS